MSPLAYLTYDQIEIWMQSIAPELRALAPAAIVGILRGGAFPAVLASHITGTRVCFMRFNRDAGIAEWDSASPLPECGSTVLLCEDFAGSGVTLVRCRDFLQKHGLKVIILTLAYDRMSRVRPEFCNDMTGSRTIFPWERHTLTPEFAAAQSATVNGIGLFKPDHLYEHWGFDLDGLFLPDIDSRLYASNLHEALRQRCLLKKDPDAPAPPPGSLFITGRPEEDRDMTQAWLVDNGLDYLELIMRNPQTHAAKQTAQYKAETATQRGVTHFMESDPMQAIGISQYAPWIRVLQWNVVTRQAVWISATLAESTFCTLQPRKTVETNLLSVSALDLGSPARGMQQPAV